MFKFRCELCGEEYETGRMPKDHIAHCVLCRRAVKDSVIRKELSNDYIEILAYRKRLRETGKRTYLSKYVRDKLKNKGKADSCPKDCYYSGFCGGARCCDYTDKTGNIRDDEHCEPFSKKCWYYIKSDVNKRAHDNRRRFAQGEFDVWKNI